MTVASCTRSSSTILPSEVDYDLPLEMLCYFTRKKLYTDENEILYNWAVAYNCGEEWNVPGSNKGVQNEIQRLYL